MRIALIGPVAIGGQVLERLVKEGHQVVGAFAPVGKSGDPVDEAAQKVGVTVYRAEAMKRPEVYSQYAELNPDLGVMAFVTDIVPLKILNCPRLGMIQYHPSLLPRHRGGSAINWAIIQGDTRTGISIFWPDKGIDTGPILMQKEVDITPDDTLGTLYFGKLFPLGVDAMAESVKLVGKGTAPRLAQDESKATYEGLCGKAESAIDWSRPTQQVYNLIRGCNPQPGAHSRLSDKDVKILDSEMCADSQKGAPGQVLEISEIGIKVVTGDGAIRVKRVQPESMSKMDSKAYVQLTGLKPGAFLT